MRDTDALVIALEAMDKANADFCEARAKRDMALHDLIEGCVRAERHHEFLTVKVSAVRRFLRSR